MEKDHGVRFTDEFYATKDDVKKALNMSSIDSIWEKVNLYRSYYTKQTSLRSVERVPFCVVLPPKLTSKIVSIEKRLSKLLIKYTKESFHSNQGIIDFEKNQYKTILSIIASNYDIDIQDETLEDIVNERLTNIPIEYLLIDHYYKTLKYFKTRYLGQYNISLFMMMYTKLRGIDFDITSLENYYRKNELINRADHVFIGKHYDASPCDRIIDMMDSLFEFNNNSLLFGIVKAVITYFTINYIKPFDYYNEEMSILMMKYVLAHSDNEDIASLIPLEELLSSSRAAQIKKYMYEAEMKNDYTYLISYLVPLIEDLIADMDEKLSSIDSNKVYEEQMKFDDEVVPTSKELVEQKEIRSEQVLSSNIEKTHFSVERKVSLPTLPVGLDENDVELVAQHLIELYPTLKKGQAHFYARHCTLGKYYTISQYKKELNCAYETARTSMDNLVYLGFYKKENIRNKFVYTPTIKN